MVQLKFSNSNIGCYQIVEASNKKRYVVDSSSINSKGTVWGFWPETITVPLEFIELESTTYR